MTKSLQKYTLYIFSMNIYPENVPIGDICILLILDLLLDSSILKDPTFSSQPKPPQVLYASSCVLTPS